MTMALILSFIATILIIALAIIMALKLANVQFINDNENMVNIVIGSLSGLSVLLAIMSFIFMINS